MDPRLKILGRTIRTYREKRELTQEQLAEAAELHWTFVSGVERGVRNISLIKLLGIAKGLDVRLVDLVKDLDS